MISSGLSFIGGLLVALIPIWVGDDGPPKDPEITITNKDKVVRNLSSEVTVEGKVENLGPGQTVWAFDRLAESGDIYARALCPADKEGRWTCPEFWVLTPDGDKGKDVMVFVSVLDDEQIPKQMGRMEGVVNTPPGAARDSVEGKK